MELLQSKTNQFEGEKAKELANILVNQTQIPKQYFEYGSLLLINDSNSEDSLQEYGFYKKDDLTKRYYKFESVTVSWCTEERVENWLKEYDQTPIEDMNSILSDIPLREGKGTFDHHFSFEQFEVFKKEFAKFAAKY